jgi:hypothetical protein
MQSYRNNGTEIDGGCAVGGHGAVYVYEFIRVWVAIEKTSKR